MYDHTGRTITWVWNIIAVKLNINTFSYFSSGFIFCQFVWYFSQRSSMPLSWLWRTVYCSNGIYSTISGRIYYSIVHFQVRTANILLYPSLLFSFPSPLFYSFFSAKFVKRLSHKTSFDGIWLLSFVIYKFVADTCFRLLRCQRIKFKEITRYVSIPPSL